MPGFVETLETDAGVNLNDTERESKRGKLVNYVLGVAIWISVNI